MIEWHVQLSDRILQKFWMDEGSCVTIGRGQTAEVNLDNTAVSREHAILAMQQGIFYVTDLESTNGTRINGEKISGKAAMRLGDEIEIAKFRLIPVKEKKSIPVPSTPADFEGTVFISPEEESLPVHKEKKPSLTVVKGTAEPTSFFIENSESTILGRDPAADVMVPGWRVARIQCRISMKNNRYIVSHLGGWRATRLNGRKLRGDTPLQDGDLIEMGGTRLRFGRSVPAA